MGGPFGNNTGPTRYNGFPKPLFQLPWGYAEQAKRTQLEPAMKGAPHYARYLLPSLPKFVAPGARWGTLAILGLWWLVEPSILGWMYVPFIKNRARHVASREYYSK